MKHLKLFESFVDINKKEFIVYRGSDHEEKGYGNYFSTDKDFALDYGDIIQKAIIKPKKIFDSLDEKNWKFIFESAGNEIYSPYWDKTYYNLDEFLESSWTSDTWDIMENYLNLIPSEYDSLLITEGGIVNFLILDRSIISKLEILK